MASLQQKLDKLEAKMNKEKLAAMKKGSKVLNLYAKKISSIETELGKITNTKQIEKFRELSRKIDSLEDDFDSKYEEITDGFLEKCSDILVKSTDIFFDFSDDADNESENSPINISEKIIEEHEELGVKNLQDEREKYFAEPFKKIVEKSAEVEAFFDYCGIEI